jgi:hypothetical protein
MAIIVPNTASVFAAPACVVGSEDKWAWLGLSTPIGASGCVLFYRSSTSTPGKELLPIVACPAQVVGPLGPFCSTSGIYAAGVSGGCALVWMKQ